MTVYRITRADGHVVRVAAETYDEAQWIANSPHLAAGETLSEEGRA